MRLFDVIHINDAQIKQYLPDLDLKNAHVPNKAITDPISFLPATNNIATITGILPLPSKTNDIYVYQPLTASGSLCADPLVNGECRKFNIYYYQEISNSVQQITSKNQ